MAKRTATNHKSAATKPSHAAGSNGSKPVAGRAKRLGRPQEVRSLALITQGTKETYQVCYKEIYKSGALDRKTKELIAIAAAAITGCQGCLMGHIRKARALGATMEQIKEAVGVAFSVNAASVVDQTDVAAAMLGLTGDEA